jgi:hypothetical protein
LVVAGHCSSDILHDAHSVPGKKINLVAAAEAVLAMAGGHARRREREAYVQLMMAAPNIIKV